MAHKPTTLKVSFPEGVAAIEASAWDALVSADDPFAEHGFLAALERSGSVGRGTGWLPRFVLVEDDKGPVGAAPTYLKRHSYGEFVFDWAWAAGAQRAGLRYYPKLVVAIPFTPVTGHRLLVRPDADAHIVRTALVEGLARVADETGASSVHVLFCPAEEARFLENAGYTPRLGMQFHWENRAPAPYRDFEDFVGAFRSRNRKQVRRERAIAAGHGLRLETKDGPDLSDAEWEALQGFYLANADKHGSECYLTPAFFQEIRANFAHRVVASVAYKGEVLVAGTLNFERGRHLYGRYWGCSQEWDMLHFELCYYQLIERAVRRGHARFEAGAQGEHKLKRGLDAAPTHSAHLIRHSGLGAAIAQFCAAEAEAMAEQIRQYQSLSPYTRTSHRESGQTSPID